MVLYKHQIIVIISLVTVYLLLYYIMACVSIILPMHHNLNIFDGTAFNSHPPTNFDQTHNAVSQRE